MIHLTAKILYIYEYWERLVNEITSIYYQRRCPDAITLM